MWYPRRSVPVRALIGVAAAGAIGVIVWKVLWVMLLPLFAALLGFLMTAFKVALIVGLIYILYRLYRKLTDQPVSAA